MAEEQPWSSHGEHLVSRRPADARAHRAGDQGGEPGCPVRHDTSASTNERFRTLRMQIMEPVLALVIVGYLLVTDV
jgi:hypothetical protein